MRKKLLWIFILIPLILSLLNINMIGVSAQVIHDVAIISVDPSPTSVKLGELVNITVTVKNNGTATETFNVTLYHDATTIETKTVQNLAADATKTLTFTWNTTDVKEEIYAEDRKEKTFYINATASTVPGETNTANNALLSYPIGVKVIAHYITVIPQSTVDLTLTPGKNYTISIYTDYNGTDIVSWQFSLKYNSAVLKGIEVVNGDLITTEKHPDAMFEAGTFDNTVGKLLLTMGFIYYETEPPPTTYGPGILANVTFTVVGTGDSNITIVEKETELSGYDATKGGDYSIVDQQSPWYGHILSGYFRNMEEVIHDISVLTVTPSSTLVQEGEPVNITVVVKNNGTVPETFDVDVWYDYSPLGNQPFQLIGTETVSNLAAGATKTLTFTWDTTGVTKGNHTITAIVEPVTGETDIDDNKLPSGEKVTVEPRPLRPIPATEIVIAVGVIVTIIAAIVYAIRRKKKPTTT